MSVVFTYISYLYKFYLVLVQNFLISLFLFNFYTDYCEENLYFYIIHC